MNAAPQIKIIPPSKEVFDIIDAYKKIIESAIPDAKITLIGSFAIPMCGKEECDFLLETSDVKEAQELLLKNGFRVGPIVDGEGFCKSKKFDLVCELHIVPPNHIKIHAYLNFIRKLQNNPQLVQEYERLKWSHDGSTPDEYKKAKNAFIKSIS